MTHGGQRGVDEAAGTCVTTGSLDGIANVRCDSLEVTGPALTASPGDAQVGRGGQGSGAGRQSPARRSHTRRNVLLAIGIAALLVASFYIARPLQPYLESTYGINPVTVLVLFVVAEVLFDIGLALMLWFGGVRRLSWKALREFKVKSARVDWHHPGVLAGLLLNRFAWCVPFVYVIVAGWGRLPWFVVCLAAAEIAVTLWIGALAMGVVRQPQMGRRRRGAPASTDEQVGALLDEAGHPESDGAQVGSVPVEQLD